MKSNAENIFSLPFGRYGKIQIAKTIVRFSAKGLPFQGENFDILRTKLCTLYGFQNVTVKPDSEDVAINVVFDCEVKGYIRNTKGFLRSMRKKLQYAMGQSYKCLHCLDRVLEHCPHCDKWREEKRVADARDLAAELASRHENDEAMNDGEDRSYCQWCKEPIDECQCNPDDHDNEFDEIELVDNS